LTKNSEKYLKESLDSLVEFDEVLILDNGSTDKTVEIALTYSNVKVVISEFIGFGALKNLAVESAKNDWILSIDSDEILSKALLKEIKRADLKDINSIYLIRRLNHYRRKTIRCCGWYPDIVPRLFNRRHTSFTDAMVHESVIVQKESKKIELKGEILHYPFDSVEDLIDKMQRYSSLYAKESSKSSSPLKALFRATFAFFKNYFLQKGFLYGFEGLLISVSNANGVFYKYMKLYEREINNPTLKGEAQRNVK
jgi:glycosyltransferase involved in cell wall biosynthesis